MLDVRDLAIPGLKLIAPKKFGDTRGFLSETYSVRSFAEAGIGVTFVQENHSLSRTPGTLRGLHFQAPPVAQDKLVRCVRGTILDIALDIRKGSPTYGRHVSVELSADNWLQLFVPKGFAHGFCTLVPDTEVVYKISDFYAPRSEMGILWNDPALGIAWPTFAGAELSEKDKVLPPLTALTSPFAFDG